MSACSGQIGLFWIPDCRSSKTCSSKNLQIITRRNCNQLKCKLWLHNENYLEKHRNSDGFRLIQECNFIGDISNKMSKWRNRNTQCTIICQKNNLSFPIICQKNIPPYQIICQKNIPSYLIICQKNIPSHLIICQKNILSYLIFCQKNIPSDLINCQKNIPSHLIICQKIILSHLIICQKNIPSYLIICQKNILSYLIICQRDGIDHRHLSLELSRASYSAPASAVAEVHKIDYNQDMYTITYSDKKMIRGSIPKKTWIFLRHLPLSVAPPP